MTGIISRARPVSLLLVFPQTPFIMSTSSATPGRDYLFSGRFSHSQLKRLCATFHRLAGTHVRLTCLARLGLLFRHISPRRPVMVMRTLHFLEECHCTHLMSYSWQLWISLFLWCVCRQISSVIMKISGHDPSIYIWLPRHQREYHRSTRMENTSHETLGEVSLFMSRS